MNAYEVAALIIIVFLTFCFMVNVAIIGIWISLRKEMREMKTELRDEVRAIGVRVSDVELEQAYMRGVMSAIQSQTQARAHDAPPSADSNSPSAGA